MTRERLLPLVLLGLLAYAAFPPPAFAYLDPGSGSYIFQLIIAGIVGLGFLTRVYWGKIKSFFKRGAPEKDSETEDTPDA